MCDFTKYLTPIPNGGFSCNSCGQPIEKGGLFCDCPECGAIYCEKCVKDGTFEAHTCASK